MKGFIHIEYLDGKTEVKEYNDYFVALDKQRQMLKNKKTMENIKSLSVKTSR
jgi:hypothetical protein